MTRSLNVSRGHALKTGGKVDEAVASYRAALKSQPFIATPGTHWPISRSIVSMTINWPKCKRSIKIHTLRAKIKFICSLHWAKAFEDRKDYAQSFHHYARGNAVKKAQLRYRADGSTQENEDQIAACTPEIFARETGHEAPDPIFILGLPRAGSTLLEQILSSHSMVDGTLELPNVLSISGKLRRLGQRQG